MIHQQFIDAERVIDQAAASLTPFANPSDRIALKNAQWVMRTARAAGQTLCDPAASAQDRSHAFDQLATLFSYV